MVTCWACNFRNLITGKEQLSNKLIVKIKIDRREELQVVVVVILAAWSGDLGAAGRNTLVARGEFDCQWETAEVEVAVAAGGEGTWDILDGGDPVILAGVYHQDEVELPLFCRQVDPGNRGFSGRSQSVYYCGRARIWNSNSNHRCRS